jgi:hypothetical protein
MHAVTIKVNALAVQMQQLIQPLYLLFVILQGLSFNFIFFADNNYDHYHHRGDNGAQCCHNGNSSISGYFANLQRCYSSSICCGACGHFLSYQVNTWLCKCCIC